VAAIIRTLVRIVPAFKFVFLKNMQESDLTLLAFNFHSSIRTDN
jgi:hypothetical protein